VKRLVAALETVRLSRSRLAKERALADVLAAIGRDPDDADGKGLAVAARLATGLTLPVGDGRSLGVGGSLIGEVAVRRTGFSQAVVWACARKTGDFGEALGLLSARDPAADERPGLSLRSLGDLFDTLALTGNRTHKFKLIDETLAAATPLETKYLIKIMLGSLRTGALAGVMETAIARAFDVPLDEIRRAAALVTDPGTLAVLARDKRTSEAKLSLGRPVAYMLATPIETVASAVDPLVYVVEDKIDGVRTQVHKRGNDVVLFARGLDPVTSAFPEIVEAFHFVPGAVALDGELVALAESGRPRPFQALQARLRRAAPTKAMIAETKVTFVAFDMLSDGEQDLMSLPWSERREHLERFARERGPRQSFMVNPYQRLDPAAPLSEQLDRAFDDVRRRGHEGLLLKKSDSPYDAGRRGQAWIKVKRAFATLDVVVTAAEEGHGRRAGVLSDYTFGVWRGDEIVNVGKAYSGLTDVEIDDLTQRFKALTLERRGGVRLVKPEIVLEIAFDGIQRSTRHKSGFALRFPRIVRIREDKRPTLADRLSAVEALFTSQLETGHREEAAPEAPAETPAKNATRTSRARGPRKKTAEGQLSLFGDPDGKTKAD
jgi:DNA ligase-1